MRDPPRAIGFPEEAYRGRYRGRGRAPALPEGGADSVAGGWESAAEAGAADVTAASAACTTLSSVDLWSGAARLLVAGASVRGSLGLRTFGTRSTKPVMSASWPLGILTRRQAQVASGARALVFRSAPFSRRWPSRGAIPRNSASIRAAPGKYGAILPDLFRESAPA